MYTTNIFFKYLYVANILLIVEDFQFFLKVFSIILSVIEKELWT